MHKQTQPISCFLPPANQDSKKPSMACQQVGAEPTGRSSGGADDDDGRTHRAAEEDHDLVPSAAPADDFEFCILSSGGLAPEAGDDAADGMCVADEVFAGGKLLPLRLSSAASADASALLRLLRSDSLTTTSSGGGSSGFSSGSVSRSTSSSSASSDHAGGPGSSSSSSRSSKSAPSSAAADHAAVLLPPRRSLSGSGSGSVFYAHPSPSPRPPPRRASAHAPAPRRISTGSAPPPSWAVIRLGVVGAPEVYAPRPPAEYRKAAAAPRSGSGSRSARFEQPHRTADKKQLALGLLGAGLVCSCSPDAVAPVGSAEVAAAEARRRRRQKKAEKKKRSATAEQSGKGTTRRRSWILEWLEDLSISKEKSAAAASCR